MLQCRGAGAGEPQSVEVRSGTDFWKVQIEAIYCRRNPHKLKNVPALLEKYRGQEVVLYKKVCLTYDLDPMKLYADPAAWAAEAEDEDAIDEGACGSAEPGSCGLEEGALDAPVSQVEAGDRHGLRGGSERWAPGPAGGAGARGCARGSEFAFSYKTGCGVFGPAAEVGSGTSHVGAPAEKASPFASLLVATPLGAEARRQGAAEAGCAWQPVWQVPSEGCAAQQSSMLRAPSGAGR